MVQFEQRDHVAILVLDRPEVRNAIDNAEAEAIEQLIDIVEKDDSIWATVITASGSVFCSGANIKSIANGGGPAKTERGGFAGIVSRERTKPLIAAVNGPALAGGFEIVLACDLVVASSDSSFGLSEVKRSMVAAAGGLFHLPRSIPKNVAMEMAITGDPIDAERAYQLGLVSEVVSPDRLMAAALALADRVCSNAPLAVRESRRLLLAGLDMEVEQAKATAEASMTRIRQTSDFTEGTRAFLEKRVPQWRAS
ncbi:enoyl-CoA hydratase-related protein [Arthrobacter sp. MI7-26]|uniref:enoyl-CoA hydratase-related protein n=1 Tax=Arthrobacter sp. MI7-26 TaxID=2993653 RepID=UPI002249263E|nr:enoyl-CoA hydratase-related protein [Arthrobacter sp. MI7-26]MCX2746842.1 enoyl-CoA hydratase-related protein [Arthrobacter sp. MI7-26]